MKKKKDR